MLNKLLRLHQRPLALLMLLALGLPLVMGVPASQVTASPQDTHNTYTLIDFGTFIPVAINVHGQAVGYTLDAQGQHVHLWTPTESNGTTGNMISLESTTALTSFPYDINDFGQVVLTQLLPDFGGGSFVWTPHEANGTEGSMTLVTDFLSGHSNAINNFGQLVGHINAGNAGNTTSIPALWTPNQPNGATFSMTPIAGDVMIDALAAWGVGINDLGQVTGHASHESNFTDTSKFLWTPSQTNGTTGTTTTLTTSNRLFSPSLNNFGQVSDGHLLWTPDEPNGLTGTWTDPGNSPGSFIHDINDHGQLVGRIDGYATLWTPDVQNGTVGSIVALDSLLPSGGQELTLQTAWGINNSGQIVGEMGAVEGQFELLSDDLAVPVGGPGYLLVPGETCEMVGPEEGIKFGEPDGFVLIDRQSPMARYQHRVKSEVKWELCPDVLESSVPAPSPDGRIFEIRYIDDGTVTVSVDTRGDVSAQVGPVEFLVGEDPPFEANVLPPSLVYFRYEFVHSQLVEEDYYELSSEVRSIHELTYGQLGSAMAWVGAIALSWKWILAALARVPQVLRELFGERVRPAFAAFVLLLASQVPGILPETSSEPLSSPVRNEVMSEGDLSQTMLMSTQPDTSNPSDETMDDLAQVFGIDSIDDGLTALTGLTVDPAQVEPGATFSYTGNQFTPNGDVLVMLANVNDPDDVIEYELHANGDGELFGTADVPTDAQPGRWLIIAIDIDYIRQSLQAFVDQESNDIEMRLAAASVEVLGGGDDAVPPEVTITAPQNEAEYLLNQVVLADYECMDEGSGVGRCEGYQGDPGENQFVDNGDAFDTSTVGQRSFTVIACSDTDPQVCDEVTHTYSVVYKFHGFEPPIKMTELNRVQPNQTVTIRWSLEDARGNPISDTSSFNSLKVTPCDGGIATVASGTGNSGLSYLNNGRWRFNWKTSRDLAGTCQVLTLTLDDGTEHSASFQFR